MKHIILAALLAALSLPSLATTVTSVWLIGTDIHLRNADVAIRPDGLVRIVARPKGKHDDKPIVYYAHISKIFIKDAEAVLSDDPQFQFPGDCPVADTIPVAKLLALPEDTPTPPPHPPLLLTKISEKQKKDLAGSYSGHFCIEPL